MAVRDAVPADLPHIASLVRELGAYERLSDEVVFDEAEMGRWLFGTAPAARVLVATGGDDEVVGMALYHGTFSTFLGRPGIWLEDLFVRPAARGRGHGRALLETLMQRTPGRLEWAVLDWNQPAIDFYRRLGARPVEGWSRWRWTAG
ncbi:MAG TPA: GNAT family N-acetyltransferase [Acidimicrobiales bacterium]|nr:GNAT family N-acetyltransferase [Acidimicrobiales bacterium]